MKSLDHSSNQFVPRQVIDLLVKTGAHITEPPTQLGECLVQAAATNNTRRIESFLRAGVDINQQDILGRTALHAVSCWAGQRSMRWVAGQDSALCGELLFRTALHGVSCWAVQRFMRWVTGQDSAPCCELLGITALHGVSCGSRSHYIRFTLRSMLRSTLRSALRSIALIKHFHIFNRLFQRITLNFLYG